MANGIAEVRCFTNKCEKPVSYEASCPSSSFIPCVFSAHDRIVSTYLVHHGYCATAESFARNTGQAFEEELASIKNRQSEFKQQDFQDNVWCEENAYPDTNVNAHASQRCRKER